MLARSRTAFQIALSAALVLGFAARPAQAQQALVSRTPPVDVAVPPRTSSGPTTDAASVAVRRPVSRELVVTNAAPRRAGYGQPVALMVVGGAALLAGLIIGDAPGTVIAVGGAIVGLYGLYEFLQ
jgi:hypothetical protein